VTRADRSLASQSSLASAPALLRLAHQLTGDPDVGRLVVVRALSRVLQRRHLGDEASLDELLTRQVLRALPGRLPRPLTPSPLDRLSRRERIATVLAFGPGWDAAGIADAMRSSPTRTRALVAAALRQSTQDEWERLLSGAQWSLPVPVSLLDEVAGGVRRGRRDHRLRLLGAGALAVAVAGAGVAVVRVATAPAPLPRTAHEPGLLPWPARGDLLRDESLLAAATRLWRAAPTGPPGRVYVLWAGRVGVGRLVVLQARDATRTPAVAVVAEHDVTFRHARLRLDAVSRIADPDPAMLLVPYDGNLNVAGLQSGPSQQVLQILVRPGVDFVDERSSTAPVTVPSLRPPFRARPLRQGLSQPWLDVNGDQPTTAVRAWSRGRVVFTGLVGTAVTASAVLPAITDPPAAWAGMPRDLAPELLDDDALWWAQVCHHPRPAMSLVWADPTSPTRSRMEFVSCAGGAWAAQYLSDGATGAEWGFTRVLRSTAAVVGRLPRTGLLVVVGDRSVATVVLGANRFVGRTFVGPWPASAPVRVLDARGRQLPL
jgi:hypothetical protein